MQVQKDGSVYFPIYISPMDPTARISSSKQLRPPAPSATSAPPAPPPGVPQGPAESGGFNVLAAVWVASDQRRVYPTGRCNYRPSVTINHNNNNNNNNNNNLLIANKLPSSCLLNRAAESIQLLDSASKSLAAKDYISTKTQPSPRPAEHSPRFCL